MHVLSVWCWTQHVLLLRLPSFGVLRWTIAILTAVVAVLVLKIHLLWQLLLRLPTSSITLADSLLRCIAVLLHLHQSLLIFIILSQNNVVIANLHPLTRSTTMTWH